VLEAETFDPTEIIQRRPPAPSVRRRPHENTSSAIFLRWLQNTEYAIMLHRSSAFHLPQLPGALSRDDGFAEVNAWDICHHVRVRRGNLLDTYKPR
jgi:hypothetical protein